MATSVSDVKVASNRNKQSEKLLHWSGFLNFNNSNRVSCKWKYINTFPIYHVSACIYLGSWRLQTNILSGIINSPSVTTSRWYLSCCHIAVGFPKNHHHLRAIEPCRYFTGKKTGRVLTSSGASLAATQSCSVCVPAAGENTFQNVWPKRQWRVEVAEKAQIKGKSWIPLGEYPRYTNIFHLFSICSSTDAVFWFLLFSFYTNQSPWMVSSHTHAKICFFNHIGTNRWIAISAEWETYYTLPITITTTITTTTTTPPKRIPTTTMSTTSILLVVFYCILTATATTSTTSTGIY